MLSINDLKLGANLKLNGEPYTVIKYEHTHMGRGGATVRLKVRNLLSGKVLEHAYKQGDKVAEADLTHTKADFLYLQNDEYYFMDSESFEQFFLSKESLGLAANFLKEGQTVDVLNFNGQPVSIKLPPKIDLKVTSAPPGVRGDTAQGSVSKIATLETGYEIQIPIFVKENNIIKINTETGEYVERV